MRRSSICSTRIRARKTICSKVFYSLLLATGCRIGELCALSWDNVDFEESKIHICKHFITDSTGSRIVEGCKTAAGDRWLYMDENTMSMLREYKDYYFKTAKSFGNKWNYFTRAVFFSKHQPGVHLSLSTARAWLRCFTKKNNLPSIHPHQFRHTAISLQLQSRISITEASKRAGHSRSTITVNTTYGHTPNPAAISFFIHHIIFYMLLCQESDQVKQTN